MEISKFKCNDDLDVFLPPSCLSEDLATCFVHTCSSSSQSQNVTPILNVL